MLVTVAELNNQQKLYVSRILGGMDGMTRLVNNLLDLGRIEAGVGLQVDQVVMMEGVDGAVDEFHCRKAWWQGLGGKHGGAGEHILLDYPLYPAKRYGRIIRI
jgi:signal transduction histidine kinase